MKKHICSCGCNKFDKGRSFSGRRAYRCKQCSRIHTAGKQGVKEHYSIQREGYQFADSKGIGHIE